LKLAKVLSEEKFTEVGGVMGFLEETKNNPLFIFGLGWLILGLIARRWVFIWMGATIVLLLLIAGGNKSEETEDGG